MAVAGLQNVSAFGPSFFQESQSQSPRRKWADDRAQPNNRASSILQMWREIESDHDVVSPSHNNRSRPQRNGSDSESLSTITSVGQGSDIGQEDADDIMSEQSSTDLGENERERVRQIFREWTKSGGGVGSNSSNECRVNNGSGTQWLGENECERVRIIREWVQGSGVDGVAEPGSRIEQVRDGLLVVSHPEIGARRPIRRLCGRQTLLDLLARAQCERKGEIQCLLEHRPVSDFPHRNRIQALLRGRFLRNDTLVPDKRQPSVAASELGLLRQRQTVSDLREGFLSKLDNPASTSVNNGESDSFFTHENEDESESTCMESQETSILTTSDSENAADQNTSQQELAVQVTETEDPVRDNTGNDQEVSLDNTTGSVQEVSLEILDSETISEQMNATVITNESSIEATEDLSFSGPHEVYNTNDLEGNENQEFEWQDDSARMEEIEMEDSEWRDITGNWHESSDNQWFRENDNDDVVEENQVQESHEDWPSHDFQEAIDSWLDLPSGGVDASVGGGRAQTFYFPDDDDDDNAHNIELRELFSRRRVSSLLRSGFRESLNQVLQSHAQRLGHHHASSGDWELDNIEQDQEQLNNDHQTLNPFAPTSIQPLWDEELQSPNLPHDYSNQQLGTEWEIINELRIDMARLHQRLNNMQSMLETCIDMQIELQRAVRQEVSAALNRTTTLTRESDVSMGDMVFDESQWDHVKQGICCLCHDSKIDSLLYRCGHMCTCSKCAEKLVEGTGKCPMCRAPVIEAVRAYFTQ